jgi:hypothetical protein
MQVIAIKPYSEFSSPTSINPHHTYVSDMRPIHRIRIQPYWSSLQWSYKLLSVTLFSHHRTATSSSLPPPKPLVVTVIEQRPQSGTSFTTYVLASSSSRPPTFFIIIALQDLLLTVIFFCLKLPVRQIRENDPLRHQQRLRRQWEESRLVLQSLAIVYPHITFTLRNSSHQTLASSSSNSSGSFYRISKVHIFYSTTLSP